MVSYPIDLDTINYGAVWDSLRLAPREREVAEAIIRSYQADPDYRSSANKSRETLDDIARRFAPISERAFKAAMGIKDIPKSPVVDKLIEAEILKRDIPNGNPIYKLNPQKLKKLERRF